jgi:hypothetical protein
MDPYRIDFKEMPWDAPAVGVRFKVHEQSGRKLRLAEFTREFVEHQWCTKGHIGYVLQGQMEIDFGDRVITLAEGDGLFIPPGEPHKHKATVLTDSVRVILVENV